MAILTFRTGTMNSSKSAQLLMVRHNYVEQGKKVVIFKPELDTRDVGVVKSRALSERMPATLVSLDSVGFMFDIVNRERPDCILVDEVQFFNETLVDELAAIADLLDIPVIAYGLKTDFQTKMFVGSKRLIEVGAVVEQVETVCWDCNDNAVYNMRLLDGVPTFDGEQVQIGGNESYKVVCRKCYQKAKIEVTEAHYNLSSIL